MKTCSDKLEVASPPKLASYRLQVMSEMMRAKAAASVAPFQAWEHEFMGSVGNITLG